MLRLESSGRTGRMREMLKMDNRQILNLERIQVVGGLKNT